MEDMIIEQEEVQDNEKFVSYTNQQEVLKMNPLQIQNNSLVIRNPVINGKLDSVHDSVNS